MSQCLSISTVQDFNFEGTHTFQVDIASISPSIIIDNAGVAQVNILDNDGKQRINWKFSDGCSVFATAVVNLLPIFINFHLSFCRCNCSADKLIIF